MSVKELVMAEKNEKDRLDKLKKQRSSHRGQVTKLIAKIKNRLDEPGVEMDELESLMVQLQTKDEQMKSIDSKIENLLDINDIESEIQKIDEYNEEIVFTSVKLKNKIKSLHSINEPESSNLRETVINRCGSKINAKLPKLTIQTYYGDPSEYLNFWNQFENSIDKNTSLSDGEKLSYLFSCLRGEALSCIKGFAITENNYQPALKLIQDTFGQRDVLIDAHMSKLLNMTPLKSSSNLQELRNLYFKCQTQIRSLESLGVKSETYSVMLCAIILKLFPSDLILEFSKQQISTTNHDLDELMKFLHNAIIARERAIHMQQSPVSLPSHRQAPDPQPRESYRKHYGGTSNRNRFISSANELMTNAASSGCIFCHQNHLSNLCENLKAQSKREKLLRERRCLLCCKEKCFVKTCNGAVCSFCNGKHARAICYKLENSKRHKDEGESKKKQIEEKNLNEVVSTSSNHMANNKGGILLQCVKVEIIGSKSSEFIFALFDNGSERTFVKKSVSERLGLKVVGFEKLKIYSFGVKNPKLQVCRKVELRLRNIFVGNEVVIEALEIDEISRAPIHVPDQRVCAEMKARRLELTFNCNELSSDCRISLLIGSDCYWDLTKRFQRLNSSLVALETVFGWSLQGRCEGVSESASVNFVCSEKDVISSEISRFWELESLGIRGDELNTLGVKEQGILREFNDSIQFVENRYCVKLPWIEGMKEKLGSNREVALKRFNSLVRRFKKDSSLYKEYREVVNDYLKEGIVELSDDLVDESTFYLPHHAVIREDKTSSRLRIVFDGTAHAEGEYSLNDCLLTGINLYPNLFELLVQFRKNAIAYTADVKQAYLQILIDPEDRLFTKFFWIEDLNADKLCVLNFTRVLFGLKPSPYLLAATLQYHFEQYQHLFPETCEVLKNSFWVDDLVGGVDDIETALKISTESVEVMKRAGMVLRKWQTNSIPLRERYKKAGIETDDTKGSIIECGVPCKVLGLAWDPDKDIIFFDVSKLKDIAANGSSTKRFVLHVLGRIFDPIGFLGPFIMQLKILIQELWATKIDWDSKLPPLLDYKWQLWCSEIEHLNEIIIPRHYLSGLNLCDFISFDIHSFSDASMKAYGCVVYLRGTTRENRVITSFICSKSRVAPIKSITLPRLELLGCLLSARLAKQVSKCLKFETTHYYWSDSTICLVWINGEANNYNTFVKNRVTEIQTLTEKAEWFHCPGKENPADILSRGISASDLAQNSLWWHGPPWLSQPSKFWPSKVENEKPIGDLEIRNKVEIISQCKCAVYDSEFVLDLNKYSDVNRVLKITVLVKRFVNKLKKLPIVLGSFTATELAEAELDWIKYEQNLVYSSELECIKNGKQISKKSSLYYFAPFLDKNDVLRVRGRLEESELSDNEIHPILLPKQSKFTELLISREHKKVCHGGVSATLAKIRSAFWIPKGRQIVKKVLKTCLICKRYSLKPAEQITAQLPKSRVLENPPFTVTGIDFTGPVSIRSCKDGNQKSYITLFTCAVTRALHIELVTDMTTKNFILSLRRFLARRGNCKVIISDNAKSFKNTESILKSFSKILVDSELKNFVALHDITWQFIPPHAPWWGGFYERLMKSIKEPLRKILGKSFLSFEEMTTILAEIEFVLNHRPLTYTSNELNEPLPLTPAQFLFPGQENNSYPVHFAEIFSNEPSTKENLTRRKLYQTRLLRQIWTKWKANYLMQLRNAHKFVNPLPERDLKVGDVVLLEGTTKSKFLWPLGIIEEVIIGRDGHIRSCIVKTSKGQYRRPIQVIYPLELT